MSEVPKDAPANRLVHSTSPYLLQHAHNPVDWHEWGEEALALARSTDKPILLSIGYSACHWCHVMAHESFEDPAIAAVMNQHFVPIKVDREERPDIDDIYMAATLAMNQGQGGWPMTVFLTPEQEPFFAGTYFPPTDRWGRPGFRTLLERIAEGWQRDRAGIRNQGADMVEHLRSNSRATPGGALGEAELRRALAQFEEDFDRTYGGFGAAPKFPPSTALSLLLRCWRRFRDQGALEMVRKTLDEMARGGIYDQIGGGFHRYSVDERWLVPHFEKMLYDNALLARVYLEGYQATGDAFHRRIAAEVLDYVLREMTSPEGGFYSATDADSEGEEGRFFVWTPAQVAQVLGEEEARRVCAWYDITEEGNWEGHSILHLTRSLGEVAGRLGIKPEALERSLLEARPKLYAARKLRVPPGLDDKVLTGWNGLMISAFAEGARVLGDARYLAAGERAARFVLDTLRDSDGRLLRTYRAGHAHLAGYLEDYAHLAEALVDLYEAGADAGFLDEALHLAERLVADFAAEDGGFFSTARDHEALIVRPREGHDGAIPSANAAAAAALARLSYHLGRDDLRERASLALRAYARSVTRAPRAFAKSLAVVDLLLEGPLELAFVGAPEALAPLRGEVARRYLPNRIVAHHDPASGAAALPLLAGKELVNGHAALYVCRDFACQRPVTQPEQVAAALAERPEAEAPRTIGARLPGAATPEATAAYAARFAATGYGLLGSTGLTVSRFGFGGYRVDDETAAHHEALVHALASGCNLIDTSSNYTEGGSEQLVGEVLAEQAREAGLPREQVVVVSKIGYVQGQNLEHALERERTGRAFPEMVKYGEGIWHCIHPEFLGDQLGRCLDRLGLATLDVLLLHNPEYYLTDAHERSHNTLDKRREEFYRRLQVAFAWLEQQVTAGRIRAYGVSSNTCTAAATDAEATSLERMLQAAERAGGAQHHFRVLQLPFNLFESGAVREVNNGDRTVLELAALRGIGVLVNRPLNAMVGPGMLRLADPRLVAGEPLDMTSQLAKLATLEAEYRERIAVHIQGGDERMPPARFFNWSRDLEGLGEQVQSLEHWEQLEAQRIVPRLMQVVRAIDEAMQPPLEDEWKGWRSRYLPELQALLAELRRQAGATSLARARAVAAALDPHLPAERRGEGLSRKALWVVRSTPGVSCVLVGMRRRAYVDDSLGVLAWEPLAKVRPVFDQVAAISV